MRFWNALADPTRRRIVELLAEKERSAGELFLQFSVTAPAISQHIKILQQSGLVNVRVEGQKRIQILNPDALAEAESWIERQRRQFGAPAPAESLPVPAPPVRMEVPEQGMLF